MTDYVGGKPWKQEKYRLILEAAFRLFSEKGIEKVTMPEIAAAGSVSRATLFRYFSSKAELVIAVGTWKWEEYITWHSIAACREDIARMTGAEYLRFFLDAFLNLYREHSDMLRFNYDFNSFMRYEAPTPDQKRPYLQVVDRMGVKFHEIYQRGMEDGTLNDRISEEVMFSVSFRIMLAAVTRYSIGLMVGFKDASEPENELRMLEELLLSRFTASSARAENDGIVPDNLDYLFG